MENNEGLMGDRRFVRRVATAAAVALGASLVPMVWAPSAWAAPTCAGSPMLVTAGCVDPTYNQPVIDSSTDLTTPVPLHKVSGHFDDSANHDTGTRFNIYLPPKGQWGGRFFQNVYPTQDENASDDNVSFGAASGAYTVQTFTNGSFGYRVDAAAAKFSKTVAASYYGSSQRIYGYIWGGSGGSYQTISAAENTSGVWDGAVPFINGVPTSIPNNFFVRAFARFVLQGKAQQIADAVAPGGSGDPFAGLNDTERAVLLEVTKMGVPLRAWEDYRYVLGLDAPDGLLGFGPTVLAIDPTYVNDFWNTPGYLGTEQSALGDMFRAARTSANESTLALLAYHRYQVPSDPSFHAWDQFRNPDGTPIYPQRAIKIGPLISGSVTGGGTFTGNVRTKVILVDNLLDTDAFPWDGDWYATRVQQALGRGLEDSFRLWYNDNTDHIGARTPRLVQYDGILQQALRDVSAWAEQGAAPARSTRYDIHDNQISVPNNAAARRGIQPVVDLTVKNGARIDVTAGQPVTFKAKIQVPPNTGTIVANDWDFTGDGNFTAAPFGAPKSTVEVKATFTYTTPGTYFAALRATSQRDGDPTSPFTKVQDLGRVRVVVH